MTKTPEVTIDHGSIYVSLRPNARYIRSQKLDPNNPTSPLVNYTHHGKLRGVLFEVEPDTSVDLTGLPKGTRKRVARAFDQNNIKHTP